MFCQPELVEGCPDNYRDVEGCRSHVQQNFYTDSLNI